MVSAVNLSYTYDQENKLVFPDIHCKNGQTTLIIGKSGVGKSTILHLLGGLMKPENGSINIKDVDMNDLKEAELDRFRGENIGIIFQKNHFVQSLSVEENLKLAGFLGRNKIDTEKIYQLLDDLNISHKAKARVSNLSEGEKQRVSIARALVNEPELILADEPTSALDDDNCDSVFNLLENQAKQLNATLIIVTHDQRLKDKVDHQIELV